MRAVILVVVMSSSAAADPPKDARAWCAVHPSDALPTGTIVWRGRLDGDGRQDVIVNRGGCGTTECLHSAFVRCRDGTYSEVFTGYAARVRVRAGGSWARLAVEHVGDREPDGTRPRSWFNVPFTDDGYQEP